MSSPTARSTARFLLVFGLMFACIITAGTMYFQQPSIASPGAESSESADATAVDGTPTDQNVVGEPTLGDAPEGALPTNWDSPTPYPSDPSFTEGFPADSPPPVPLPEGIGGGENAGGSGAAGSGAAQIPGPYPGSTSSSRPSSTYRPRLPQASTTRPRTTAPTATRTTSRPIPRPTGQSTGGTPPAGGPTTTEGGVTVGGSVEIAQLINDARARAGAPRADIDLSMWDSASACAISNVRAGYLSHSLPGCRYENLAMWPGSRADAAGVVRMWVNSPGHARAMLDPKVTAITVAWASDGSSCVVAASFARAWNATT